jgi:hypothetical protein
MKPHLQIVERPQDKHRILGRQQVEPQGTRWGATWRIAAVCVGTLVLAAVVGTIAWLAGEAARWIGGASW